MSENTKKGKLIVFSGPSGTGKGTVLKKVFTELPQLTFSISATTREPREGEEEGVNYFFKTETEFKEMIDRSELLEWAEFVGNYYGTPKDYVDEQLKLGNNVILEIEVEGARQIKKIRPDSTFIFLAPPSLLSLKQRLLERSTEDPEKIEKRLNKAKIELKESTWFEHIVVNHQNKSDQAAREIINIINS
ncbi:MAG TPA: guanylate kinase [Vampirovibrionales bacterium]